MNDQINSALENLTFYPYWLDNKDAPSPEHPLIGKTEAELLIVGGGFTGLWSAIISKEKNPDLDVVLIEAETIAYGASGRPGAIVSTSVMHGLHIAAQIFPKDIAKLEELGHANMQAFREAIKKYEIDCDDEWGGELTVSIGEEGLDTVKDEYDLHVKYGHDVELLDEEQVKDELNSPLFKGGFWSKRDSGTVHPAKLAWGLKAAAKKLGVRIYEHSALKTVDDLGDYLVVKTRDGSIVTPKMMLCTNAFAAGHKNIKKRVAMVRDRILMSEPLTDEQLERLGWKHRQGVYDTRTQLNYMRLTKDNRMLFGGRLGNFMGAPHDPKLDRTQKPYERLAEAFFNTFPQMHDVKFSHAWSGPIALTTRMAVHFQSYYGDKALYAGGYSGFGVSASRFGAEFGLAKLFKEDRPELEMEFAATMPNWMPPEPFRYIGSQVTMYALDTADEKGGWRDLWLAGVGKMGFPLSWTTADLEENEEDNNS